MLLQVGLALPWLILAAVASSGKGCNSEMRQLSPSVAAGLTPSLDIVNPMKGSALMSTVELTGSCEEEGQQEDGGWVTWRTCDEGWGAACCCVRPHEEEGG